MVVDHRQHMVTQVRNSISLLSTPVLYAVNSPFELFDKVSQSLTTHKELLAENQKLRAQQVLLMGQLQKLQAIEQQNNQLLTLLKSPVLSSKERLLAAEVLAIRIEPFISELILDKGSNDGAYVGQAVIDANGIMGQIIQTGPWTSRLLLISDTRSAVPIRNNRTGLFGIVVGQGDQQNLTWANVPVTADVKQGDLLVSSGLGGHYPAGYPIGVVRSVQHDPDNQFESIFVTPSAQLNRTANVLLIWPTKINRPIDNSLLQQPTNNANKNEKSSHSSSAIVKPMP